MDIRPPDSIIAFSDGACSGNPGPGGWAAIVITPDDQVIELGDSIPSTTNNRMEIVGALRAIKQMAELPYPALMYTDSTYVIRGITEWIWAWQKRGWKSASGEPVANADLWQEFARVTRARQEFGDIEWRYVRGHIGVDGNERCDKIAVAFSKGKRPKLFKGPLHDYDLDMSAIPSAQPLPEMKPQGTSKKAPAFSYLSYVNGVLTRHDTWPDCERAVKGRPGAKFKKSTSAADEIAIVKDWGLNPERLIKGKS